MLKHFYVRDFVQYNYWNKPRLKVMPLNSLLSNEDTGILIFSPGNEEQEELFNQRQDINILYKSPKAYNKVHPGRPRNTVYIFERNENWDRSQPILRAQNAESAEATAVATT